MAAGSERLLARAANRRAVDGGLLGRRLRSVTEKYVLKHNPAAEASVIDEFLDGLHADDLLLVMACEAGDQSAWTELFEGYGATVRSAARSTSSNEAMAEDVAQSIWAELHGLKA